MAADRGADHGRGVNGDRELSRTLGREDDLVQTGDAQAASVTVTERIRMSGPFIFIATNKLREGKLAAERDRAADLGSFIEANEPQVLAFNEYVNDDGTEVGVVQIHPDAASMEFHMDVVAERAARAYAETLEATTSIQVYGEPSDAVLEMLRRQAGGGVPMTVKRRHLGGFTRVKRS